MRDTAFREYALPEVEVLLRVAGTLTTRPADAEDLVRDTLRHAYQAVERLDGRHPRPLLLALMREIHRGRSRGPDPLGAPGAVWHRPSLGTAVEPPEPLVVGADFDAVADAALAELPPRYRGVVSLVDVDGLSYVEAAGLLGTAERTVRKRLYRARRRIRIRLAAAGLVPRRGGR